MAELDINRFVKSGNVELGPEEHPQERSARLRREEREHRLEQTTRLILFLVTLTASW